MTLLKDHRMRLFICRGELPDLIHSQQIPLSHNFSLCFITKHFRSCLYSFWTRKKSGMRELFLCCSLASPCQTDLRNMTLVVKMWVKITCSGRGGWEGRHRLLSRWGSLCKGSVPCLSFPEMKDAKRIKPSGIFVLLHHRSLIVVLLPHCIETGKFGKGCGIDSRSPGAGAHSELAAWCVSLDSGVAGLYIGQRLSALHSPALYRGRCRRRGVESVLQGTDRFRASSKKELATPFLTIKTTWKPSRLHQMTVKAMKPINPPSQT